MAEEEHDIDMRVMEIADYIFANPTIPLSQVVSHFVTKCHKHKRTIWRYIAKATEYNKVRIAEREAIRRNEFVEHEKEQARKDIMSRDESLARLSTIARGDAEKIVARQRIENGSIVSKDEELIYPTHMACVGAIKQLSAMQGWEAVKKIDIDVGQKPPQKVIIEFIDFSKKIKNNDDRNNANKRLVE
jgi:hypothetical protein